MVVITLLAVVVPVDFVQAQGYQLPQVPTTQLLLVLVARLEHQPMVATAIIPYSAPLPQRAAAAAVHTKRQGQTVDRAVAVAHSNLPGQMLVDQETRHL